MSSDEIVEDLRASYSKYGPLRKVVVTQFGVAGGETRKRAVPEWPEARKEVKDYYEHLKLKAADNIQSVKPAYWWEKVVNDAAAELKKAGVKPGEISKKLVSDFPLSESRILFYLRPEYKQPEKVRAGETSGSVRAARTEHADEEGKIPKSSKEEISIKEEPRGEAPRPGAPTPVQYHGTPPSLKQNLVSEFTPSQMALVGGLRYLGISYEIEKRVEVSKWSCVKCHEQYDVDTVPLVEKSKGGRLCRKDGELLERQTRKCDILIWTAAGFAVSLEVEGAGSSSKDNEEREKLLREAGVRTAHIPNKMADQYPEEIAGIVKAFLL